jgi:predicted small secreted protein
MRYAVFLIPLLLAACNTVEGFGRDLSQAGDALSGAAHDARQSDGRQADGRRSQSRTAAADHELCGAPTKDQRPNC